MSAPPPPKGVAMSPFAHVQRGASFYRPFQDMLGIVQLLEISLRSNSS